MRAEHCMEDMTVISSVLATVTSDASRFLNATISARREQQHPRTAVTSASENDVAAQMADIETKLAELAAKYVRLTHALSDASEEQIRADFSEDRYEDLQNVGLSLRGLEGYINTLLRDSQPPHPYLQRLGDAVTEYCVAISDLLMVLDPCFREFDIVESKTAVIDEGLFANFSF